MFVQKPALKGERLRLWRLPVLRLLLVATSVRTPLNQNAPHITDLALVCCNGNRHCVTNPIRRKFIKQSVDFLAHDGRKRAKAFAFKLTAQTSIILVCLSVSVFRQTTTTTT